MRLRARALWLALALLATAALAVSPALAAPTPLLNAPRPTSQAPVLDPFFDDLEKRTFRFFWESANPDNGLVPDHFPGPSFSSIAGVGFALTAYPIGVERGYVTREAARDRALATLRFFASETEKHGFFYHFIDMKHGGRGNRSEISTVDTTFLLAGILVCQSYFDGKDPREVQIRRLAEKIYRRVDWTWAEPSSPALTMGWTPEKGFIHANWVGYDEGMLVYILALGSPTHAVSPDAWKAWTSTYEKHWGTQYGQTDLSFGPSLGHQYSHVWVDFRSIQDNYMRGRGIDYFENSRRATYVQQRYAIENPMHWQGYGENVWGLTACEGPGNSRQVYDGVQRRFYGYAARGVGLTDTFDDGTIAPTAAIGSLPFAPEIVIPATLEMYKRYGDSIYSTYGFRDSFNPSYRGVGTDAKGKGGWVDDRYLAIDQGPILAMIENYRSELVWRIMRNNDYVRRGLERAGFEGGWLQTKP